MSARIAFTQPYVPRYRVPLFDELARVLAGRGHELRVYSGQPRGEQATRADSATGVWHRPLPGREIGAGRWALEARSAPRSLRHADLLVSELSARNELAWRRSFSGQPMVLWGHGKSYVNDPSWLADRVEWSLARRASHVMTYADGGRRYMIERGGFDPDRVTAIGNSTDTLTLRAARLRIEDDPSTSSVPTALFIGALDSTKRLDFVLDAFREARAIEPAFRLVVAGEGGMASDVDALAESFGGIERVGDVRGADLARIAARGDAIWMPGRVGLVAVDALALGLPIHTTPFPYHAPEVEFLREGEIQYLPDDPVLFARRSLESIASGRPPMRDDIPTVQSVAANMADVFEKVIGA